MNKVVLKNEFAEFSAAICGAKPLSYVSQGREWLAGYVSPMLFPIIGPLPDDEHIYNGKTYHIPMHGFAQKMEFEVAEKSDTSVSLVLSANEKTLEMYPFEFRLTVCYMLDGKKLITRYKVENLGESTMYYGIGSHLGFNITLPKDDYTIVFDSDLEHNSSLNILGNPGIKELVETDCNKLKVKSEFFERGAVIIGNHNATSYELVSNKDNTRITYHSTDFPYLTVWSDTSSPFLCIEPWSFSSCHCEEKKDLSAIKEISVLESGETAEYQYDIICEFTD